MKRILFLLMIAISLYAYNSYDYKEWEQKKLYKADITPLEAFEMKTKGVLLIDVRTKREYEFSHVPGALWIPVYFEKYGRKIYNEDFIDQVKYALDGDLNKPVMLICRTASRTKFAANILTDNGFTQVYNVLYGFLNKNGWIDSGLQYWKKQ